jgi:hypothetical protein
MTIGTFLILLGMAIALVYILNKVDKMKFTWFKKKVIAAGKEFERDFEQEKLFRDMQNRIKKQADDLRWEMLKQQERELRKLFDQVVDEAVIHFKNTVECPHKPGDGLVLNIYGLKYDGSNSWDGGPNGLHCTINQKYNKNTFIAATCTEVRVSRSLIWEKIDNYISRVIWDKWEQALANPAAAKHELVKYLNDTHKYNFDLQYLGVYWDVFFKTNTDFQPQWGLNAASWLPNNSPEAIETVKVWMEEIDIEERRTALKEKLNEIEKRKKEIGAQYKGIRIIPGI